MLAAIPTPVENPDPTTIMLSRAMQTTAPAVRPLFPYSPQLFEGRTLDDGVALGI
jgi:hypothetical protein